LLIHTKKYNHEKNIPGSYWFPVGTCDVQIAIVDKMKHEPRINLAIRGKSDDGWYQLGKISIIK
jgi:hypothetical protein